MIIAVVTTLNERDSIGGLVRRLHDHTDRVYVVDDSSSDGTDRAAGRAGAKVVTTGRVGIGPALIVGWREALHDGANRIVQIDAGGSHDPDDIPVLLASPADVVIGSRFMPGAVYTGGRNRRLLSQAAAAAMNRAAIHSHTDWTSGFRVFRRLAAQQLAADTYLARMHGWQIEVLLAAHRHHSSVDERPISYRAGRSSFNRQVAVEAFGVWRQACA